MAFTVTDFTDLIDLLNRHPKWRAELRRQILDEEFLKLPEYVRALDARLGRVEVGVEKLAEAQVRTEYRVGRLGESVVGLDHRVGGLETKVDRLEIKVDQLDTKVDQLDTKVDQLDTKVDRLDTKVDRLEDGMDTLKQSHKGLATAIAQLQTAFGSTVEEEAESVLRWVLEEKGYRLLSDPLSLPLNGEVDVIVEVESPSGERVWAVVEAKARLGYRQVRSWGQQMQSEGWQRRLAGAGVPGPFLVYAYGIRYDPGAVRAAEEEKIGLMSLKGERVTPQGLIQPAEPVR